MALPRLAISGITGAIYGPANAYLADITPPEKRAAAFGSVGAAFGARFVIGPAIGGLLADLGRAPFFAAAALVGERALWLFRLARDAYAGQAAPFRMGARQSFGAFRALTRLPGLGLLAGVFFPVGCWRGRLSATWPFFVWIALLGAMPEIGWSLAPCRRHHGAGAGAADRSGRRRSANARP